MKPNRPRDLALEALEALGLPEEAEEEERAAGKALILGSGSTAGSGPPADEEAAPPEQLGADSCPCVRLSSMIGAASAKRSSLRTRRDSRSAGRPG